MSAFSPDLIAAFLATHYRVNASADQYFTLRINSHSPELHSLHAANDVSSSAYLTAWNPLSEAVSPDENHAAQDALLADLKTLNVSTLTGFGLDPTNEWHGEEHILAIGLSRDIAVDLGKKYKQNALVWNGPDAVPELILLR